MATVLDWFRLRFPGFMGIRIRAEGANVAKISGERPPDSGPKTITSPAWYVTAVYATEALVDVANMRRPASSVAQPAQSRWITTSEVVIVEARTAQLLVVDREAQRI